MRGWPASASVVRERAPPPETRCREPDRRQDEGQRQPAPEIRRHVCEPKKTSAEQHDGPHRNRNPDPREPRLPPGAHWRLPRRARRTARTPAPAATARRTDRRQARRSETARGRLPSTRPDPLPRDRRTSRASGGSVQTAFATAHRRNLPPAYARQAPSAAVATALVRSRSMAPAGRRPRRAPCSAGRSSRTSRSATKRPTIADRDSPLGRRVVRAGSGTPTGATGDAARVADRIPPRDSSGTR